jgi:hypothetical protein
MCEALAESRGLRVKAGFTGSVVGIQIFEVAVMYTGTVIHDLMKTAERVANQAAQQIQGELHGIFTMQIPINQDDQVYQGAA